MGLACDATEGIRNIARNALWCRRLIAALIVMVSLAVSPGSRAGDLDKIVPFNIQAKTLDKALLQFGAQADVQIAFAWNSSIGQVPVRALTGSYTGRVALALLLKGTHLTYSSHNGTIEVKPEKSLTPDMPPSRPSESATSHGRGNDTSDPPVEKARRKKGNAKHNQPVLREITVTGTRIEGETPVGAPMQRISRVQIERSGYVTLNQLLESLPDNFRGGAAGATPDAPFTRGANNGSNITFGSGVDLRGLGNDATLVLINGHRVAPSGAGSFTDVSSIPLSAIDHIDVLSDGASAIYGSDAIAGVVNIVLRGESSGINSDVKYGSASGFSTYDVNTQLGKEWSGGGFTIDQDYSEQGTLFTGDRSFTSTVPGPTSLLPSSRRNWLSGALSHAIASQLQVHGDVEYSDTNVVDLYSPSPPTEQMNSGARRLTGAAGVLYRGPYSWVGTADVSAGEGIEDYTTNTYSSGPVPMFLGGTKEISRFSQSTVGASGKLFSLSGGEAKLALGASYLVQGYSQNGLTQAAVSPVMGAHRNVAAGYGELFIPLVGVEAGVPGVARLTLEAAGRYDRYSDFGGTTNYKFGISWFPIQALELRGGYSTSFRAPAVGDELMSSERGTTGALLFPLANPQGTALIPVLFAEGAMPHLMPETATNFTVGLNYRPPEAPLLTLSANYYRIQYSDQLAAAPFEPFGLSDPALSSVITEYATSAPIEAFVASAVANGAHFINATRGMFGADPLSSTLYLYDIRIGNLSITDTSGVDLSANYRFAAGQNQFDAAVFGTYIRDFFTQLTPDSIRANEVNTVGYPANLRVLAQLAWSRNYLTIAWTGNFINGYPDTTSPTPATVGSFLTFNLTARYQIGGQASDHAATISVAATNIFNRDPPYVAEGALGLSGSHYDAANASPIGRMITVELAKRW